MKYNINITYNQKGQKLTGKDEYSFVLEYKYCQQDNAILDAIHEEVPEALIDHITFKVAEIFEGLELGDFVCINYFDNEDGSSLYHQIGTVKSIAEKALTVVDPDTLKEYKFDFNGIQIAIGKKECSIDGLNEDEVMQHQYYLKKQEAWQKIKNIVEEYADEPPSHLDADELNKISEMLDLSEIYDHFGM